MTTHFHLRRDGLSVLLELPTQGLPIIHHWGADLGEISTAEARALSAARVQPVGENQVDVPLQLSVIPEHWRGWVGRPGLAGSRLAEQLGQDWSPLFVIETAVTGGKALSLQPASENPQGPLPAGHSLQVVSADQQAGLRLTLDFELCPGPVLRARATLQNTGQTPYQLEHLNLAFPLPQVATEILDFTGHWGRERSPQRHAFPAGVHLREGRKGRTGSDAAYVLHAGTPGFNFHSGQVWGVHVGWSGNHTHYAERAFTGHKVIGGGELLAPGEVVLEKDQSYVTPWVYGSYGQGLDQVAHCFHRYLRARPQHPDPQRPVTLNVWEAVYFDQDLDTLLELADKAAQLGVERFVLDDGWFGARRDDRAGLGDWWVAKDIWPQGLHPLVNRVKELGMQFGLWFEPEMINLDSDTARAHPDWVLATGGRLPVPSRHQQVINLGNPQCYAYIRDAMNAILNEYNISYIKWDHNRDLIDAGSAQRGGAAGVHEQTLATYRLMQELKAAHPGLEIESCSSGGSRVDLGVLEHTDRVWVSDCIDPHERQLMLRCTTQLIPPEMMGSHIASRWSHSTGRSHDLNFRAATALFGHLGIEWDVRQADQREFAELAEWISFYKANRDWLLRGNLVRLDMADEHFFGHGIVSADQRRALFQVSVLDSFEAALPELLSFAGLRDDLRYRVQPLALGSAPSGLVPPHWWGAEVVTREPHDGKQGPWLELAPRQEKTTTTAPAHSSVEKTAQELPGIVLPGRVLQTVGIAQPRHFADHGILYLLQAID